MSSPAGSGVLTFLFPQSPRSRGKQPPRLPGQGAAWLTRGWAGHCGIGPGGHPMGGASAARAQKLDGKEVVTRAQHSPGPSSGLYELLLQAAC